MNLLSPKRRWLQYSLRSLLLVMLLVAFGMSWVAVKMQKAKRQRDAVDVIEKLGGSVTYASPADAHDDEMPMGLGPPGQAWPLNLLGENLSLVVLQVNFDSTDVTDAGLECIKGLTQLQRLHLNNTTVTDAGLKHLRGLSQLRSLSLCGTQITDTGLEHLKGLTQLQELSLIFTRVTPAGVKRLQQVLPKCRIDCELPVPDIAVLPYSPEAF